MKKSKTKYQQIKFKLSNTQKTALKLKFFETFGPNTKYGNLDSEIRANFVCGALNCFEAKNSGVFGLGPFFKIISFLETL